MPVPIAWEDVFYKLWLEVPSVDEGRVLEMMRLIMEESDYSVFDDTEELEAAAKKELNMVNRDDVRRIASEEFGMIDGPGEER